MKTKNLILVILALFTIMFVTGCFKDEEVTTNAVVQPLKVKYEPKEYILELDDFSLRSGPDSIFALKNLVLDNILVSNSNQEREITAYNTFKVQNVVLTPDSSDAEIGYQGLTFKKYDIQINFKDGSEPELLNAYVKSVGDSVYVHTPNNSFNVLHSFAPHAIKWTRLEPRDVLKMMHPFNTNTVYAWKWARTRYNDGEWVLIEEVYLGPNNKGNNFNVPLVF